MINAYKVNTCEISTLRTLNLYIVLPLNSMDKLNPRRGISGKDAGRKKYVLEGKQRINASTFVLTVLYLNAESN